MPGDASPSRSAVVDVRREREVQREAEVVVALPEHSVARYEEFDVLARGDPVKWDVAAADADPCDTIAPAGAVDFGLTHLQTHGDNVENETE